MKELVLSIFDETEYGKLFVNDDFSVRVFVESNGKVVHIYADGSNISMDDED